MRASNTIKTLARGAGKPVETGAQRLGLSKLSPPRSFFSAVKKVADEAMKKFLKDWLLNYDKGEATPPEPR